MLWHNIIGRLLKPSLQSEIRAPFYSWDLNTTLLRTRGNLAANQRSHIESGKSDVQASLLLADVIQSGLPTCPNNMQSTYQSGMSDFPDILEFRASYRPECITSASTREAWTSDFPGSMCDL